MTIVRTGRCSSDATPEHRVHKGSIMRWSTNKAGQITLCPLVAYRVTTIDGQQAICVRLEFVRAPGRIGKKPEAVQLVMSPAAAEGFRATLGVAIDRVGRGSAGSKH